MKKIFNARFVVAVAAAAVLSGCFEGEQSQNTNQSQSQKPAVQTPAPAQAQTPAAQPAQDKEVLAGADLYKKCAGCHGANGKTKALGKSREIALMSKDEALKALKGYKDGSYGGEQKALMKGQVASLGDQEIDKLADFISTFK